MSSLVYRSRLLVVDREVEADCFLDSPECKPRSPDHYGFGGDVQIRMTSDSLPVFSIPWTHHGGR